MSIYASDTNLTSITFNTYRLFEYLEDEPTSSTFYQLTLFCVCNVRFKRTDSIHLSQFANWTEICVFDDERGAGVEINYASVSLWMKISLVAHLLRTSSNHIKVLHIWIENATVNIVIMHMNTFTPLTKASFLHWVEFVWALHSLLHTHSIILAFFSENLR